MDKAWLAHHGIKGQRWGVRRFENPDGTLTEAGKKRYGKDEEQEGSEKKEKFWTDKRKSVAKKIAIGSAVVTGSLLVTYGGKKYVDYIKNKAGQDILDKGNKLGDELLKKSMEYMSYVGNPNPGVRNFGMVKSAEYQTKSVAARKQAVDEANDVMPSFFKSVRYLREQKKLKKKK